MKKKKVVTLLASLALVAVVGVGGTLAYLSDQTGTLENKFTFTTEDVDITLWENKVDANNDKTGEIIDADTAAPGENGNKYTDVQPNEEMDKNPTVKLEKGSQDSYLFVKVTNPNDDDTLRITDMGQNWKAVSGATDVYVWVASGADENAATPVAPADYTVFEHVQAGNNLEVGTTTFQDITIKAAAIQGSGDITYAEAKTQALGFLQ